MNGPSNGELADMLCSIAGYLSLEGESPYRILAYEKAAELFRRHPLSVAESALSGRLRDLPGVGAAIEGKVLEYLRTGDVAAGPGRRARGPGGVGVVLGGARHGPQPAPRGDPALGIADLTELEQACRDGRVAGVPGMGEKTQAKLLRAIEDRNAARAAAGDQDAGGRPRLLLAEVEPQAASLLEVLLALPSVSAADVAGSLRRRRSTVRDIDLVAASHDATAVMEGFSRASQLARIEQRGDTKLVAVTHTGLNVDLRIVPPASYGNLLQHLTGSAGHNVARRAYAQGHGLKMSEYHIEHLMDGTVTPCATEADVYAALGLDYIPPELREDQGEIEAAETHALPVLISRADLRGDLHVHSDWTDGKATMEEMARAAQNAGLEYLCFCDHSQALAMTGGLDPARVLEQILAIRDLDSRLDIRVLAGIEVDILLDGRIDLPDDVLARLDFVTASIHSGFHQSRDDIMRRLLSALHNPHVDSIAHLTGRLINRRPAYDLDLDAVAREAAATGTFLEINGSPDRLDLDAVSARRAVELGATLVICSDAHHPREFANLDAGVAEARRGWVTAADVANTRSWAELAARGKAQ
jgi:DNA polymerase (family 10)